MRDAFAGSAVATEADAKSGSQLVGAALGATDAVLGELVPHRIGERLHRAGAVDGVAVQVEQGVELVEAEDAVALQQREAGGAQGSTDQHRRVGLRRRRRWLVVAGRAAAVAPLGARPQAITGRAQRFEDLEAAGGESLEVGVEGAQLVQQRVALHLQVEAQSTAQAGGVAHRELAARA
jgi:hypothetical protein